MGDMAWSVALSSYYRFLCVYIYRTRFTILNFGSRTQLGRFGETEGEI